LREEYTSLRDDERIEKIQALRYELGLHDAEEASDIEEIAQSVISSVSELGFIDQMKIKIGYVRSYERKIKKGRAVLGDCRKVNTVFGAFIPYDFIVTIYSLNTSGLSDKQMKILIWHELRHITISERGLTIAPHDVEDFDSIIESCGLHWDGMSNAELPDICEVV